MLLVYTYTPRTPKNQEKEERIALRIAG